MFRNYDEVFTVYGDEEESAIDSAPWWRWLQFLLMLAGAIILVVSVSIVELLRGGNSQRKAARSGQHNGLQTSEKETPLPENSNKISFPYEFVGKMKW